MLIKKKQDLPSSLALVLAVIIIASSLVITSNLAIPAAGTTTPAPVTATTDNGSVNVLISWEPSEIVPNQDTQMTLDFQDPSSGESISHVNYNFEIKDENGETVQSMSDLHTHSGSDEQTATFDNNGRYNLVVTIIGTGIDPPFDTTQSGTAETTIAVGEQLPDTTTTTAAAPNGDNATTPTETTTTSNTTTATTPAAATTGIELSQQPVYQELQKNVDETPINETHSQFALSGNGTLTLPNGTETIRTTSTGSVVASTMDGTATGKEILTTEDGTENATATFYGIARFNMQDGTGKGIIISLVHTNSTGTLAPLDGMILAGPIEFQPDQTGLLTLWEWQSGIPFVNNPQGLTQDSQMEATTNNTTTTSSSETSPTIMP